MTTENILAPVAALTLPDPAGLTNKAQNVLSFVQAYEINDDESYGFAAEELTSIKTRLNQLEKQRTAITGPLNAATKAVNDLFRGPTALLTTAESGIKSKMLGWQAKVEAAAAEERRKAEAAAAAERQRLEADAAARQAEAQAQAQAAQAAAAAGDAQAAALAQAASQRAQDEATAAATTAQVITAPVAQIVAPKATGISTSTKVDFEVSDLLALVKHVAEHPELLSLLVADSVKLRAYVRGLGMNCKLPGVRVFENKVMSARAA